MKFMISVYRVGKTGAHSKTSYLGTVTCQKRTANQIVKIVEKLKKEYAGSCSATQMIVCAVSRIENELHTRAK